MSATARMWKRRFGNLVGGLLSPFKWYGRYVGRMTRSGMIPPEWMLVIAVVLAAIIMADDDAKADKQPAKVNVEASVSVKVSTMSLDEYMESAIGKSKDPDCMRTNLKQITSGAVITKGDVDRQVIYCDMRWDADAPTRERLRQQAMITKE